MNREEFLKTIEELYSQCLDTLQKKNADYAAEEDPFANFRRVEALNITSVERGILTRISDKLARIVVLLEKKPDVADESMEDTIADAINYLAILYAWRKNKRE